MSNKGGRVSPESVADYPPEYLDTEKYIMLRYIMDAKSEDKYLGYDDVDDNIFSTIMGEFYDYVLDNPNPR